MKERGYWFQLSQLKKLLGDSMSNADTLWLNRNRRLVSFGLEPYECPMRKRPRRKKGVNGTQIKESK